MPNRLAVSIGGSLEKPEARAKKKRGCAPDDSPQKSVAGAHPRLCDCRYDKAAAFESIRLSANVVSMSK